MNKNYLRSAIRNIIKSKFHFITNVICIAAAFAGCWLVINYEVFETSYDQHIVDNERVFRIQSKIFEDDQLVSKSSRTSPAIFQVIKNEIPCVDYCARMFYEDALLFSDKATLNNQPFYWADSTFFDIYKIPFLLGSSETCFDNVHSMVISNKLAVALFGDENPMGKTVYFNENLPFEVTGVFQDLPANSNLKFEALATMSTNYAYGWMSRDMNWRTSYMFTWVKLKNAKDISELEIGLKQLSDKYLNFDADLNQYTSLYAVNTSQLHFHEKNLRADIGNKVDKRVLGIIQLIALLVFIIALINVINHIIAQTIERLKGSGIRKVNGASKTNLVIQYAYESFLLVFSGIVLAIALFYPAALYFSNILDIPFEHLFKINSNIFWFTAFTFMGVIFLLAIVNVLFVNNYKLTNVLKGKVSKSHHENSMRRILVIIQYTSTMVLLLVLFVMFKQVNYMRNADYGLEKENVVMIGVPFSLNSVDGRAEKLLAYRNELKTISGVEATAYSLNIPGRLRLANAVNVRTGSNPEARTIPFAFFRVGENYFNVFGIDFIKGRTFNSQNEDRDEIILNQSAVKRLGLNIEHVINEQIYIRNNRFKVAGVVKDFHHNSLKYPVEPSFWVNRMPPFWGYFSARLNGNVNAASIQSFETIWKKHFPNDPFDYYFLDQLLEDQIQNNVKTSKVLAAFTLLVMLIATTGILGISVYFTSRKTKEIGVRKVNGARVFDVLFVLNKSISIWIIISFAIAIPLAHYIIEKWLQNFAYKTEVDWWVFLVCGIAVLSVAFLTVSLQSIKAALQNPIDALRYE